ncbi:MAG: flagellar biosynthesis protein FlhB [Desulfovibrionaceae bacterium]|nr:flagellar biosynthesis protein FlhB [Desulfovibrionaceae bacterium]
MPQKDPSRTEKATPKRRDKVREDGNVPKGSELSKSIVLLAGVLALRFLIGFYHQQFHDIYVFFLKDSLSQELTPETVYYMFLWSIKKIALMVMPLMLMLAFTAYLTMRLQVGKLWTTKVLKPKFGKIFNVISGLKNLMLSAQAFVRFGRSILQALAVGIAPYIVIKQEIGNLVPLFYENTSGVAMYLLSTGYKMACYALVPMMLIGIADLWYTRWDYEENLKMTKDEIKDERRQAEGDPVIKAQQQRKMLEVMARRMLADVPKADVVITNPTHLAVALRYDIAKAPAPMVLAKGANHLAEKIKEVARENNVPIRENKPLAQALYKQVEIGQSIPEELYQAVAAVLASLDKFRRQRG